MNASNASLALATGEAAPTTSVRQPPVIREPVWVKWLLITVGLGWFAALLPLPLATVFIQALSPGLAFSGTPSASRRPSAPSASPPW